MIKPGQRWWYIVTSTNSRFNHKYIIEVNRIIDGDIVEYGTPWTVHYRGTCHLVSGIHCQVPMISEWKPEKKSNPRAFFTATVSKLEIDENNVAILT